MGERGGNIKPRPITPEVGKSRVVAREDAFKAGHKLCQNFAPLFKIPIVDLGQFLIELFRISTCE